MIFRTFSRIIPAALLLCLPAFIPAGCRSTAHHQERAVERARKFLLKNAPELTPNEIGFIRFNKPVLLVENILGGDAGWAARSGRNQICVTWLLPEREEAYMVFGASSLRMTEWSPNRLIRRKFAPPEQHRLRAFGLARTYVLNNLYKELSVHELNLVRFSEPEVVRTDYLISHDYETEVPVGEISARTQYSFLWRCEEPEKVIIVGGLANDDLSGFRIFFAGLTSADEVENNRYRPADPAESAGETAGEPGDDDR